jgi:hypothetical protein
MKKQYLFILAFFALLSVNTKAQSPGDIIITEIMADPSKVSDNVGEWFEVYNTTNHDIKINAWHVTDLKTKNYKVNGPNPITIKANGFFLFAISSDANINGGLVVDCTYGFTLVNSAGKLAITDSIGKVIDSISYAAPSSGKSWNLDPNHFNAVDNNNAAYWCVGSAPYGAGDFGTPRTSNSNCTITSISMITAQSDIFIQARNGELNIQFPDVIEKQQWEIINITGQVVQSGTIQDATANFSTSLDRSDRGIYFFRLQKSAVVLKFIIQ